MNGASSDPSQDRTSIPPPVLGPAVSPRGVVGESGLGSAAGPAAPFLRPRAEPVTEMLPPPPAAPAPEPEEEDLPWLIPGQGGESAPDDLGLTRGLGPDWEGLSEAALAEPEASAGGRLEKDLPEPAGASSPDASPDADAGWYGEDGVDSTAEWVLQTREAEPTPLEPAAATHRSAAPEAEAEADSAGAGELAAVAAISFAEQSGAPVLEEVAQRLERIARSLRDRSPAELFDAEAGSDPLQLLITGYALGYAEALRGAGERRRPKP